MSEPTNSDVAVATTSGGTASPTQGEELDSLDFSQLLGGPLTAAVTAEAQAAMVTMNYIEAVGFQTSTEKTGPKQIQSVDFSYSVPDPTDPTKAPLPRTLTVPLLSMVPIPYLRIQQLSVDLNVKLTQVTKQTSQNSFVNTDNADSPFFSPVDIKVAVTDRNASMASNVVDRVYNMSVKMLATQASLPGGLGKVLNIFEDAIEPQSAKPKSS